MVLSGVWLGGYLHSSVVVCRCCCWCVDWTAAQRASSVVNVLEMRTYLREDEQRLMPGGTEPLKLGVRAVGRSAPESKQSTVVAAMGKNAAEAWVAARAWSRAWGALYRNIGECSMCEDSGALRHLMDGARRAARM
jgi:hypothetical protein